MRHKKRLFKRNKQMITLLSNLYISLLIHGQIVTTFNRAKLMQTNFNHFFTTRLNKIIFLHNILNSKNNSNYIQNIRVTKTFNRKSDCSYMSLVTLVYDK